MKTRVKRSNCYECRYRKAIVGSAHSSCHHPSFDDAHSNEFLGLFAILSSAGRIDAVKTSSNIIVKGDEHNGWFNHPFNFDPVWLTHCNGFKNKG